jgi:hypothetical protein
MSISFAGLVKLWLGHPPHHPFLPSVGWDSGNLEIDSHAVLAISLSREASAVPAKKATLLSGQWKLAWSRVDTVDAEPCLLLSLLPSSIAPVDAKITN